MSKKVELNAEQRAQLVLRMLSKEEPAVQDRAACGDCGADAVAVA